MSVNTEVYANRNIFLTAKYVADRGTHMERGAVLDECVLVQPPQSWARGVNVDGVNVASVVNNTRLWHVWDTRKGYVKVSMYPTIPREEQEPMETHTQLIESGPHTRHATIARTADGEAWDRFDAILGKKVGSPIDDIRPTLKRLDLDYTPRSQDVGRMLGCEAMFFLSQHVGKEPASWMDPKVKKFVAGLAGKDHLCTYKDPDMIEA
ncbi:MAG: hypothetical protein HYS81_03255 [Candidatus Aenigmatarchaeota archaeon]|nr:MAG: hypothetical protein HYS81_03255 [Candidatus Aenigmarchaeota archaeon]